MPWLDDSEPAGLGARTWKTVFKKAFLKRIEAEKLSLVLRELSQKHPTSPDEVACVLFSFRARESGADDPLLFDYAQTLLNSKTTAGPNVLLALLDTSPFMKRVNTEQQQDQQSAGLPTCEERMFNMLTQIQITRGLMSGPVEAHGYVLMLARWMNAVAEYETGKQLEAGALHSADVFSFGMYEALASLVFTILSSEAFRSVSRQPWWKKRRAILVSEMENFDSHVLQWMQSQLAGRLRALTTIPPFLHTDAEGRPIFTDQQILQNIPELQAVNSRAGLFVWLNASLCSRPLTDDIAMLTYLQTRFAGNNQALAVDLLVAAFDVLTNSLLRKETEQSIIIFRSFICNKMPLLLSIVSGFMAPAMTVEACMQMAFLSITMDALPPISVGSNEVREKLKETRLEFLQACALHGLISESTISTILQETSTPPRKANKYNKENLVAQCSTNVARLEPLIDELTGMVGNAGAIAGCVVDIINSLCVNKDTMSLKTVCNMLIRKIESLDIIMQYTQPPNLLLPLCVQLNGWTHDQDQTEFTPAYEEFASILLFVFAAVHRYGLTQSDLGLPSDDTFVVKLLRDTSVSIPASDLTEEQSRQLAKWVEGLYATDEHGESSGISDEVMRQCPPQDFYQLVPTLFEQSVLACQSKALTVKIFRGGLDFLVEPFLLPSLVGGLSWVVKHSWEDHGDAEAILMILDKLLKPSSSSQETKAMHKAILGIVAKPLYESLQSLNVKQPKTKQVKACIDILKPYLEQRRTIEISDIQLEEWVSMRDGGIRRCVRNSVGELISWITSVGPTPPPKYTHELFAVGCETLGANAMRDAIIDELKDQTNLGNGPLALDVCTSMVCAPLTRPQTTLLSVGSTPSPTQTPSSNVREAVRLYTTDVQKLLHMPTTEAEALVRLSRRVEAQLAITQMPQIPIAMPIQDQTTDQVMADLGLTDEALAAPAGDASMDQLAGLDATAPGDFTNADLTAVLEQSMDPQNMANMAANPSGLAGDASNDIFADLNMDLDQPSQQMLNPSGSNVAMSADGQQNVEEDIFAGLDMDIGEDFNFS